MPLFLDYPACVVYGKSLSNAGCPVNSFFLPSCWYNPNFVCLFIPHVIQSVNPD